MDLVLKVLMKDEHQRMRWENLALTASTENSFEWVVTWKKEVLVRARLKKGFSQMSASDVFIDDLILRRDYLTLWEDKKQIAALINQVLYTKMQIGMMGQQGSDHSEFSGKK